MTEQGSGADIPASEARADIAPSASPMAQPQVQYSPDGRWWWNGAQWVANPAAASAPGQCMVCGATPAIPITLRSVVAMVVFGVTSTQRGIYCRDCGIAAFRKRMNQTLLTGWWGFLHFFINIYVVITNLAVRARLGRLAAPTRDPGAQFASPGRPVFLRPGFVVFAAAIVVAGAYLVAQRSAAAAPFPAADTYFIGTCAQQSGTEWSETDCSANHNGKVVSLAHSADGCPSQDTPVKLDDGNYTCIDTSQ